MPGAVAADTLGVAARVVAATGPEHPADQVLRETFKALRDPETVNRQAVTHAVFSYFRWRGWLDEGSPMLTRLRQALELAGTFIERPASFSDDKLVTRAVPVWIHEQVSVKAAWVRALQTEPKLWLRARKGQGKALGKKLGDCWTPGEAALADAVVYRGREDLFHTSEFHAGEFEIQDVSSQAVGLICDPQPGETWWDACAGEGGKLLHLSDLMGNKGLIWASDRAEWRLRQLKRRAGRAKCFNYRAVLWDGGVKPPTKTRFDGVLVDAPCSGVGTWQRNPHARWTTTLQDVRELSNAQQQLLMHAAPSVKSGGRLVYSVCTLTRAETVDVVAAFARQFPDFTPLECASPFNPAIRAAEHWFWPQDAGGNGMFVAAWRRKAE